MKTDAIKSLIEKAGIELHYARDPLTGSWCRDKLTAEMSSEDLEKFAEMVVRECVAICLEQRNPANLNYKPSESFAEAIKMRFGVWN